MKKRFLTIVCLVLTLISVCLPAYAAQQTSVLVPIRVEGVETGQVKVEGNGSSEVISVSGATTYTITHDQPGNYDYTFTQVAGTDPWMNYDTSTEYKARVYVYYNDANELSSVVEVALGEEKEKPMEVCFTNTRKDAIEKEETKTITRTITYTEYTPDGKEVFKPVVQTVTLRRTVMVGPDGNVVSTGPWSIVSDPSAYGAVTSGTRDGWNCDTPVVPVWAIDLSDPKDALVHVLYTPVQPPTPSPVPNTGDSNRLLVWAGMGLVAAGLLTVLLARKKQQ